jgi:enoyl-CoA hydratase
MSGVRLEREGLIARVIIDRPGSKNAIDRTAMVELDAIVGALESDRELRAVIVSGAGGFFVSGGDLRDLSELTDPSAGFSMSRAMQATLARLAKLPAPSIAAIEGGAYGGGWEIAVSCDLRVMSLGAKIAFRQNAMGLTPGWGGGARLVRLVGPSRALLLLSTAAEVGAEEAHSLGLIDRVPSGSAVDEALKIAQAIAALPRDAVQTTKRALTEGAELPLDQAIENEARRFQETWGSEEHLARFRAFLESKAKR